MIKGSGIDIIEVQRIQKAIERWGESFLRHVFTEDEIAYANKQRFPQQHYAGRFAAKEAVLKAFGENAHINWKDIKIMNQKNGRPVCVFCEKDCSQTILVSISHTENYAVASALITE